MQWKIAPIQFVATETNGGIILWSNVIIGFIFFSAFGFGTEALSSYSRVARIFGFQRSVRSTDLRSSDTSRSVPLNLGARKCVVAFSYSLRGSD